MPKYYIPEFYIKNFFLSFLVLIALTIIATFIIDNVNSIYFSLYVVVPIGIIGLMALGYFNASCSYKEQNENPLYLHLFIITIFFITSAIWSEPSMLTTILRELAYLIFLQLGVYLYNRKKRTDCHI